MFPLRLVWDFPQRPSRVAWSLYIQSLICYIHHFHWVGGDYISEKDVVCHTYERASSESASIAHDKCVEPFERQEPCISVWSVSVNVFMLEWVLYCKKVANAVILYACFGVWHWCPCCVYAETGLLFLFQMCLLPFELTYELWRRCTEGNSPDQNLPSLSQRVTDTVHKHHWWFVTGCPAYSGIKTVKTSAFSVLE